MHKKLLIPGPTEVSQEILSEQTHPMIGHREKEFSEFYGGITDKIAKFFELKARLQTHSNHFVWYIVV